MIAQTTNTDTGRNCWCANYMDHKYGLFQPKLESREILLVFGVENTVVVILSEDMYVISEP